MNAFRKAFMERLFCVLDHAFFSQDDDLYLSWIVTIGFYLISNFRSSFFCFEIGYRICINKNPNFSSSRECICLTHTRKTHGDIFHFLYSFYIVFHIHTPRPWAYCTDCVSDLDDLRLYAYLWNIVVVSFDDIDRFFIEAVFSCDSSTDFWMCSFDIMIHSFSEIMEKSSLQCKNWICTDKFGDPFCDIGDFL